MAVRVLFFGVLRERIGAEMPLDGASNVAEARLHFATNYPELAAIWQVCAVAVNQQYAGPDTPLAAGDEIAFLPPVSGGSSEAVRLS